MHRQYKMIKTSARLALGVVLGLLILVFGALASGAAVYHALHHTTDSHSASCAICSFVKGQIEAADAPIAASQPVVIVEVTAIPASSSLPQSPSLLLPPGRAPPFSAVAS